MLLGCSDFGLESHHLRASIELYILLAVLSTALSWSAAPGPRKNRLQLMSTLSEEIDAFWRNAEIVVGKGDFDSYAAMYHRDAVVVEKDSTQLAQAALVNWKHGFEETAAGLQKTRLLFRFSLRLDNSGSAFATGIFRYELRKAQEKETSIRHVFFESLMVRKESKWLWLMENQKGQATREEWDALQDPRGENAGYGNPVE